VRPCTFQKKGHEFFEEGSLIVVVKRKCWQQADLELHSTFDQNAESNAAIAGTGFANLLNDRPSSPSKAAARMVMNLAIGPGGI
jgi:hypothetical protein